MPRMKSEERRRRILERLESSEKPIPGGTLAEEFGVSRQVIVTDIAILRAQHPDLVATRAGYVMMHADACRRIFKVRHGDEETEDELQTIVDLGGTVLDVFVEHRVYGTIRAPLDISSKRDVERFMADMRSGVSSPLKNITKGYHYHTVEARSVGALNLIQDVLREKGFLIEARESTSIYGPKSYNQE